MFETETTDAPLILNCQCGKTYHTPASSVGRVGRCRNCQSLLHIPSPTHQRPQRTPNRVLRKRTRGNRSAGRTRTLYVLTAITLLAGGVTWATGLWGGTTIDDPLDCIPANMDMVMQLRIRDMFESTGLTDELHQKLKEKRLVETLDGFDPLEIETVYLAANAPEGPAAGPGFLMLIEGTFKRDRIGQLLDRAKKSQITSQSLEHHGHSYLLIESEQFRQFGQNLAVAWLQDGLVAMGTESTLHQMFDTIDGKSKSILSSGGLASKMKTIDRKALVWLAARVPESLEDQATAQGNGIRSFFLSLGAREDLLALVGELEFDSDKSARQAHKSLKDLASNPSSQPPLAGTDQAFSAADMMESFQRVLRHKSIESHSRSVRVEIHIDLREVEKVMKDFANQMERKLSGLTRSTTPTLK